MNESSKWLAGANALLGAWLVAIPFLFANVAGMGTGFAFWNYVIVGGGILAFSGYNLWALADDRPASVGAAVGSVILGLWLIATPFVTQVAAGGWLLWNDVIVGAIVAGLAGYNAYEAADYDSGTVSTTST